MTLFRNWVLMHPVVWAANLFSILYTAVWFGTFFPAGLIFMYSIVVLLPLTVVTWAKKHREQSTVRYRALVINLTVPFLTIMYANNLTQVAMKNAQPAIDAAMAFRAKNGRYPQKPEELVPAYIDSLPKLMPVVEPPSLRINGTGEDVYLFFYTTGMFDAQAWSFKKGQWENWT